MIASITWPIAAVIIAGMALFAMMRWLGREHIIVTKIDELSKELVARDRDWVTKFEAQEKRVMVLERAVHALSDPNRAQPLGKAYSALRQG